MLMLAFRGINVAICTRLHHSATNFRDSRISERYLGTRVDGGRDRDRTCDPLDVNEVLSR